MKSIKNSYKKINNIDRKTYLKISSEYNKFLMEKVLEGHEITLPARVGTLAIIGKKQTIRYDENNNIVGLAPDYYETKKLWLDNKKAREEKKILYHMNEHTDNVRYRYFWSKRNAIIVNKTLYALRITRTNKRAVNKLIKSGTQYMTK